MQKADKFVWPMSWNSRNGYAFLDEVQGGGLHLGFDFNWGYGDQDLGRDVVATASGIVLASKNVGTGLGETIILLHELPDGTKICSRYGHLKSRWISEGQEILINQGLAQCGKSGGTQYAHLHFELFTYEFYEKYLKGKEGYYPSKWTREHILQYFFDPEKFIKEHLEVQEPVTNYEEKIRELERKIQAYDDFFNDLVFELKTEKKDFPTVLSTVRAIKDKSQRVKELEEQLNACNENKKSFVKQVADSMGCSPDDESAVLGAVRSLVATQKPEDFTLADAIKLVIDKIILKLKKRG